MKAVSYWLGYGKQKMRVLSVQGVHQLNDCYRLIVECVASGVADSEVVCGQGDSACFMAMHQAVSTRSNIEASMPVGSNLSDILPLEKNTHINPVSTGQWSIDSTSYHYADNQALQQSLVPVYVASILWFKRVCGRLILCLVPRWHHLLCKAQQAVVINSRQSIMVHAWFSQQLQHCGYCVDRNNLQFDDVAFSCPIPSGSLHHQLALCDALCLELGLYYRFIASVCGKQEIIQFYDKQAELRFPHTDHPICYSNNKTSITAIEPLADGAQRQHSIFQPQLTVKKPILYHNELAQHAEMLVYEHTKNPLLPGQVVRVKHASKQKKLPEVREQVAFVAHHLSAADASSTAHTLYRVVSIQFITVRHVIKQKVYLQPIEREIMRKPVVWNERGGLQLRSVTLNDCGTVLDPEGCYTCSDQLANTQHQQLAAEWTAVPRRLLWTGRECSNTANSTLKGKNCGWHVVFPLASVVVTTNIHGVCNMPWILAAAPDCLQPQSNSKQATESNVDANKKQKNEDKHNSAEDPCHDQIQVSSFKNSKIPSQSGATCVNGRGSASLPSWVFQGVYAQGICCSANESAISLFAKNNGNYIYMRASQPAVGSRTQSHSGIICYSAQQSIQARASATISYQAQQAMLQHDAVSSIADMQLRLQSKANIRLQAEKNINVTSRSDHSLQTSQQLHLRSQQQIHCIAEKQFKLQVGTKLLISAAGLNITAQRLQIHALAGDGMCLQVGDSVILLRPGSISLFSNTIQFAALCSYAANVQRMPIPLPRPPNAPLSQVLLAASVKQLLPAGALLCEDLCWNQSQYSQKDYVRGMFRVMAYGADVNQSYSLQVHIYLVVMHQHKPQNLSAGAALSEGETSSENLDSNQTAEQVSRHVSRQDIRQGIAYDNGAQLVEKICTHNINVAAHKLRASFGVSLEQVNWRAICSRHQKKLAQGYSLGLRYRVQHGAYYSPYSPCCVMCWDLQLRVVMWQHGKHMQLQLPLCVRTFHDPIQTPQPLARKSEAHVGDAQMLTHYIPENRSRLLLATGKVNIQVAITKDNTQHATTGRATSLAMQREDVPTTSKALYPWYQHVAWYYLECFSSAQKNIWSDLAASTSCCVPLCCGQRDSSVIASSEQVSSKNSAHLNRHQNKDLAGSQDVHVLAPPLIINIIDAEKFANKTGKIAWFSPLQIQQLRMSGGVVTLFVHGFDIDPGGYGHYQMLTRCDGNLKDSFSDEPGLGRLFEKSTQKGLGNKLHQGWGDELSEPMLQSSCVARTVPPEKKSGKSERSQGAHAWIQQIEYNLNQAAGSDGSDYRNYQRIVGIIWDSSLHGDYADSVMSAKQSAASLASILAELRRHEFDVSIIAHSLGCGLSCCAINLLYKTYQLKIQRMFMWQAAVPNTILQASCQNHQQQVFSKWMPETSIIPDSGSSCTLHDHWHVPYLWRGVEKIFVLYSDMDNVLGPYHFDRLSWAQRERGFKEKPIWPELIPALLLDYFGLGSVYHVGVLAAIPCYHLLVPGLQNQLYRYWLNNYITEQQRKKLPKTLDAYIDVEQRSAHSTARIMHTLCTAGHELKLTLKQLLKNRKVNVLKQRLMSALKHNPWWQAKVALVYETAHIDEEITGIRRVLYLLHFMRQYMPQKVAPALGYTGPDMSDARLQQFLRQGQLILIDESDELWQHSAMYHPSEGMRRVYKKIVAELPGFTH